jgi:hypothetical protein
MIQIGSSNWVQELMAKSAPLGNDFWSNFRKVNGGELVQLENAIGRKLPEEFKEFYRLVGCGSFPLGGSFESPVEIASSLAAPIFFVTGSMTHGAEWASHEDHKKLWLSRGQSNAAPQRFTEDSLTLDGVKLYDLLQFGSDGCCCYHQLYVGPQPAPFCYCLLTDSQTIENMCPTFSRAMESIVEFYLSYLGAA